MLATKISAYDGVLRRLVFKVPTWEPVSFRLKLLHAPLKSSLSCKRFLYGMTSKTPPFSCAGVPGHRYVAFKDLDFVLQKI